MNLKLSLELERKGTYLASLAYAVVQLSTHTFIHSDSMLIIFTSNGSPSDEQVSK